MWRTGLLYLDRGDSAIITALRDAGYNTQQSPGSPIRRSSTASSDTEVVWERRAKSEASSPQGHGHWGVPADVKFNHPPTHPHPHSRPKLEDPMEFMSPTSDATLFEEPQPFHLNQIKEDDAPPDYFSYDGDDSPSVKTEHEDPVLLPMQRVRQPRAPSTPSMGSIASTLGSVQRASRTLPPRSKTHEGLLQLQANPAKPPRPARAHSRRISLGLPIKSSIAQTPESHHVAPSPRYSTPSTLVPAPKDTPKEKDVRSAFLIQKERELEYKHRHTFIGTASLDDFLEVLDVSSTKTTTKAAVIKAFILLASSERLLARQASLTPSGWGLVSQTAPETCNTDYVEQAHARLGAIILRQFLDLIPFDEDEKASAMSVVDAFSAASHLDAKASSGIGSKAKAFRLWMVRQME